jgi:beta-lactamase regulating signal transducer with metallopeptidase domain
VLEKFMTNFLHASLIGSIGILALIILRKSLSKKYTQNFIYYIWLLIIVRLLIPFKIPIYISQKIYNNFYATSNSIMPDKIENKVPLYQGNASTIIHSQHHISIINIIAYIWLTGVILIAVYYICTYLKLIRTIKYFTYDVDDNEILTIYKELICKLKSNKKICLKYYDGINSPFGMGFLKPCIVIPNASYSSTEIKLILKHELIHFKKHDLLYKIGLVVVKILHWFNPLVYVMCKLVHSDCELACDESLLKDSGIEERKLYAMTFVNSFRLNKNNTFENGIITGFNHNKNILTRRIENMLNLKNKKPGVLIGALSAVIISSSLISVNVFAKDNVSINVSKSGVAAKLATTNSSLKKPDIVVTFYPNGLPKEIKTNGAVSQEQISEFMYKNYGFKMSVKNNKPHYVKLTL